ncbi:MAG: NAD(P)/FAD-dependent oxidoreductase, partial [Deltaproteobacteria bacterium]|nr:NAD(P)/FAD-dependent oxidoreductase [Deltaproteobacteria bacterium]
MPAYDVVILGTGAAGSTAAQKLRKEGKKVAVVESYLMGGTCLLRGCDPKKVLVGAEEAVDRSRRLQGKGVTGSLSMDWNKLVRFKKSFTEGAPDRVRKSLENMGLDIYEGRARFTGKNTVDVNGTKLSYDHVIIATGAHPRPLAVDGAEHLTSSEDFMNLSSMPGTIVFVGGGFISFEFCHIAARMGCTGHILEAMDKALGHFDQDLVKLLVEDTEDLGFELHLNCALDSVEKTGNGFTVRTTDGKSFQAGLVVHGAGMVPSIDGLDLDKAQVTTKNHGIEVDDTMQNPGNPAVYAAG